MTSLSIHVSREMADFIKQQMTGQGFLTRAEFLRDLIRSERDLLEVQRLLGRAKRTRKRSDRPRG